MAYTEMGGSELKFINAVSSGDYDAAGSGAAVNLGGFTYATMIVNAGSVNNGLVVNIARSSASNGTFSQFGASTPSITAACQLHVRSFTLDSSNIFYRAEWDNGTGSANFSVTLMAQGSRHIPVDQESGVTVSSDVIGG